MDTKVRLLTWDEFVTLLAKSAGLPRESLSDHGRTVPELPIDSLALAEIVAALVVDLGVESVGGDLDKRDWRAVTLDDLYAEYANSHGQP